MNNRKRAYNRRSTRPTLLGINHDGPVELRELGAGHEGIVWTVQPENFDSLAEFINEHGGPDLWKITPLNNERKANKMNNRRNPYRNRNRLSSVPTREIVNELHNRKRIASQKQSYKKRSSRLFESLLDTYGEDQLFAFVEDEPGASAIEREVLNYLDGDISQLEDLKEDIRYELETISLYDQY